MSIYVFITDECRREATIKGFSTEVEKLKSKLETEQNKGGLIKYPPPFFVKKFGKPGRLVIEEKFIGGNTLICFLRFFIRSDPKYRKEFLDNPEQFQIDNSPDERICKQYLNERTLNPVIPLPEPDEIENLYLYSLKESTRGNDISVLESDEWVTRIQNPTHERYIAFYWKAVLSIFETNLDPENNITAFENKEVLYKFIPSCNKLFLVAPFDSNLKEDKQELMEKYATVFNDTQPISEVDLQRNSRRSYPSIVLYDSSIWIERIEKSTTANMALSPEELGLLEGVLASYQADKKAYPIFINGRPGSGKSTVLQYLFAEHLFFHMTRPAGERLPNPPLYLTYNDGLLTRAKETIENILKCDSKKVINQPIDLNNSEVRKEFDRSFGHFHNFLYSLLSRDNKRRFQKDRYVSYSRFRDLWIDKYSKSPNADVRELSPELAWHVIRTYIKGMRHDSEAYFDLESYSIELPRDQKTVTEASFSLIYSLCDSYYRELCEVQGYWDDQDLTWSVLSPDEIDLSKYPVVYCDESQDFTHLELNLIHQLNLFSKRRVQSYLLGLVPFAFAGDPFQTLNPTGFNWDATQANFHNMIIRQMELDETINLEFNFYELGYNYRSTTSIVNFCNLIQLLRGIAFNIKRLIPQKSWFTGQSSLPVYFENEDLNGQTLIQEQKEIVIIVPCQEGEEYAYCQADDYLKAIVFDQDGNITRNVQSPIRAKGLEFSRVVLYKFGDQCVTDYPELIKILESGRSEHLSEDEALPLEYFVNRLYVAASRPQRRLFIIDTKRGIHDFWKFFNEVDLQTLITRYPNEGTWTINDLAQMQQGTRDNWVEDRDDPRILAENFFADGKANQSIYQLNLAKNNFLAVEPPELYKAELCQALIYELEDQCKEAGDIYYKLNDGEQAINFYWKAQAFFEILKVGQSNRRLTNSLEHHAAQFIVGKKSDKACEEFLEYLRKSADDDENISTYLSTDNGWRVVFSEMIKELGNTQRESNNKVNWKAVFVSLMFFQNNGLIIESSREFSRLAYLAEDHARAVQIWRDIKPAIIIQPDWIIKSHSEIEDYPENLKSLYYLKDYQKIAIEYLNHGAENLSDNEINWIFEAVLNQEDLNQIESFVKKYPKDDRFGRLLEKTLVNEKIDNSISIGEHYLHFLISGQEWRAAHDFINTGRIAGMTREFSQRVNLSRLDRNQRLSLYLGLLVNSNKININNPRQVSDFLSTSLVRNKNKGLTKVVSPLIAGAAVERTGIVIDALKFYEDIIIGNWGSDPIIIKAAKERWVKCKRWQIDHSPEVKKKRFVDDLTVKLSEWKLSEDDFLLSQNYGEFGSKATKRPEEKPDKTPFTTTVKTEGAPATSLKKKPAYAITTQINVGNTNYSCGLSQRRHKLEISDGDSENMVTVYYDKCELTSIIETRKILRRQRGDTIVWEIEGWNIQVSTKASSESTLVRIEEKETENGILTFEIVQKLK